MEIAQHLANQGDEIMQGTSPYSDILGWVKSLKLLCVSTHSAQMITTVAFLVSLFPNQPHPMHDPKLWRIPEKLVELVKYTGKSADIIKGYS